MKTFRLTHIVLALTLVAQGGLFHNSLSNLVLCIRDDGHVSMEWRWHASYCEHQETPAEIESFNEHIRNISHSHDHCIDIDLHRHGIDALPPPVKNPGQYYSRHSISVSITLPVPARSEASVHPSAGMLSGTPPPCLDGSILLI